MSKDVASFVGGFIRPLPSWTPSKEGGRRRPPTFYNGVLRGWKAASTPTNRRVRPSAMRCSTHLRVADPSFRGTPLVTRTTNIASERQRHRRAGSLVRYAVLFGDPMDDALDLKSTPKHQLSKQTTSTTGLEIVDVWGSRRACPSLKPVKRDRAPTSGPPLWTGSTENT